MLRTVTISADHTRLVWICPVHNMLEDVTVDAGEDPNVPPLCSECYKEMLPARAHDRVDVTYDGAVAMA